MKNDHAQAKDIDSYIALFPSDIADVLRKIRIEIAKSAPNAEEKISYCMPTFTLEGNLVHFAAFKHHIGFYPGSSGIEKFKAEFSSYETSKGTVRFPFDKPVPFDLIQKIVEFRVLENLKSADFKRKK